MRLHNHIGQVRSSNLPYPNLPDMLQFGTTVIDVLQEWRNAATHLKVIPLEQNTSTLCLFVHLNLLIKEYVKLLVKTLSAANRIGYRCSDLKAVHYTLTFLAEGSVLLANSFNVSTFGALGFFLFLVLFSRLDMCPAPTSTSLSAILFYYMTPTWSRPLFPGMYSIATYFIL